MLNPDRISVKKNRPTERGSHILRIFKRAHLFWSTGRNILQAAKS